MMGPLMMLFAYRHPAIAAIICFVPPIMVWFCGTFYILCGAVFGINPFESSKR